MEEIETIDTSIGIGGRSKIVVYNANCDAVKETKESSSSVGFVPYTDDFDDVTNTDEEEEEEEEDLPPNTLCKRAKKLHVEVCMNRQPRLNCQATPGLSKGQPIKYGNDPKTREKGVLTTGDAFDCDVNGDGIYDPDTERFYYVSDYFDTYASANSNYYYNDGNDVVNNIFDDDYAVLIYYSNMKDKQPANVGTYYDLTEPTGRNYNGPVALHNEIPTTTDWPNVTLKNENRMLLAEYQDGHNKISTDPIALGHWYGGDYLNAYSYAGKAARLLTAQEVMRGCNISELYYTIDPQLDSCHFLLENTNFALNNSPYSMYGYYLETADFASNLMVWAIDSEFRDIDSSYVSSMNYGFRPAIEVPKSRMYY